jgi:rubrerythrin
MAESGHCGQGFQRGKGRGMSLYEHAFEPHERDDSYPRETRAPWDCTACGSRNWPSKASPCPLCREDEEEPVESEEEPCPL